jgi:hypothetical protein
MAIQISGCTVIDDERNIVNVNDIRVGLVTITGSSGNIETPGTITAERIDFPLRVIFFSPADGATEVPVFQNITIIFDQVIEKGTGNITLRSGSAGGTILQTIAVSSTAVTVSGSTVVIDPPNALPSSTNIYVVVDAGAFVIPGGQSSPLINTYDFITKALALGDAYRGGFLICCTSTVFWVVAPNTSEVSRTWYLRDDANTRAQQVSGCTGWFVPTVTQLQNPGYTCRTLWDSFSSARYWSSTECCNAICAFDVNFCTGAVNTFNSKSYTCCVRAFRCITY